MEQIKAMLEAIEKDTAFGEDIQAFMERDDTTGIIAAAAKKGFVFTETDWQAYIDWSKSLTAAPLGQELEPEELENVVGGGGPGSPYDPYHSGCWFHAASEPEFRDGAMRRRCNQFRCKAYTTGNQNKLAKWYICGCWNTDRCVGAWHQLPQGFSTCG